MPLWHSNAQTMREPFSQLKIIPHFCARQVISTGLASAIRSSWRTLSREEG